jgi:MEMO1 family protein
LNRAPCRAFIRRIVLLGPAHHVRFTGLAAGSASGFATPLGRVPLDREAMERVTALRQAPIRNSRALGEPPRREIRA